MIRGILSRYRKDGVMEIRQKRREMLREFYPLLTAVALQQILALIVNLVDNFMLGTYSELAMSGASLVNQIQFMMQQLTAGVGAGVAVLGALCGFAALLFCDTLHLFEKEMERFFPNTYVRA